MKRRIIKYAIFVVLTLSVMTGIYAQESTAFSVEGDVIEYNAKTGWMTASGASGVKLVRGNLTLTGTQAEYNTQTRDGKVSGNVRAVDANSTLTADTLRTVGAASRLEAAGNAVLTRDNDRLYSPRIDYYQDKQYALATGNAKLVTADAVITAAEIETFLAENRSAAKGNVYIVSDSRDLQARSDQAVYYAARDDQQGRVVMTGNARAVQNGNTIAGQTLTLYLDDKAIDAQGRTKLHIKPGTM